MTDNAAENLSTPPTVKRPGKANFDHIYDQPEPREYFITLDRYDYLIPTYTQRAFGRLIDERAARDGRPPRVFDLACSYGVNAALLNHRDVTFDGLAERYATPELQRMNTDEVVEADRAFFAERLRPDAATFYGCDVAGNAIHYGERVGLLERGWGVNLETETPGSDLEEVLAETDVVTVSAAIGYLTYRTVGAVLSRIPEERRPWFAAFSLRTAPIDPVAHALRDCGLELATLTGRTVPQRRFVNEEEQATAIEKVRQRGYVVDGCESDGYWHAQFYVGMPADEEPLRMVELIDN